MSEAGDENSLRVVFYSAVFFLIGIFFRQLSFAYKVKTSYYGFLYIVGVLFGLLSFKVSHVRGAILPYCGPICLQTLYLPLFFFETGFLVDANELRPKVYLFAILILMPMWIIIGGVTIIMGLYVFPYDFKWPSSIILILFSMTPDVQATKIFFRDRYRFADPNLVSLLEFEGLMCGTIASFIYHAILLRPKSEISFIIIPFVLVATCVFGFCMGELVTFWLKRILNDIVIQTTITIAVIFITFCLTATIGLYPGLAVLVLSLVMMREKPSISNKSIMFICKFIEIFRFAFITVLTVVAGMELVIRLQSMFSLRSVTITLIMYIILFTVRFAVLLGVWFLNKSSHFKGVHEMLMVCACNVRGPFNIVLTLALIHEDFEFPWADDQLFMLASFQIVLSFFVTVPIANLMFNTLRKHIFDFEKLAMIYRCAKVLKDVKTSFIDMLKKMEFTADADWNVVVERTHVRKNFMKKYEDKHFYRELMPDNNSNFIEKRIRRDSIRLLLRSQRHYLTDQFEQGLISRETAQQLNRVIMHAEKTKSLMTADNVMKMTSPSKFLLRLHQELACDLNQNPKDIRDKALWLLIAVDTFINLWGLMGRLFSHFDTFVSVNLAIWIYDGISLLVMSGFLIRAAINKLKQCWNYLLVIALLMSLLLEVIQLAAFGSDWFHTDLRLKLYSIDENLIAEHIHVLKALGIGLTLLVIFIRALTIAYCLPVVKKCLIKLVYSILARATYVQCEALQSFLHIMQDSLHHLPESILDAHLMQSMQLILHQEHLATRQYLGILEVISPKVLTSLKTYIASRLILNSKLQMVITLKNDGLLDDLDVVQLQGVIHEKIRHLNHLSAAVEPPSVKQLLDNEPFMLRQDVKSDDFEAIGEILNLKPRDVLFSQGKDPQGIFIILKGLVRAECRTNLSMFNDMPRSSPVYYIQTPAASEMEPTFKLEIRNFYSKGTVLGERPLLTGKPSHKTIRCVTNVQALFLPSTGLKERFGAVTPPGQNLSVLEENLWRDMSVRLAARLIQGSVSADTILTRRKVYHILEHAFLVIGEPGSVVKLHVKHFLAVVLINGSVWDINKEHRYLGPTFIPPRVTQLDLTVNSKGRAVFLVLPDEEHYGLPSEGEWTSLRRRSMGSDQVDETSDELTLSSASSDGFPHKRYRETIESETSRSTQRNLSENIKEINDVVSDLNNNDNNDDDDDEFDDDDDDQDDDDEDDDDDDD